jgi:hypothetical protein
MIESDKNKVQGVLNEVSNAMTRIAGERDFIKEAIKEAADKYQIDKKQLRKLAKVYHNQTFAAEVANAEEFQSLYETIVK